jgi:hypothetical protein
MKTELRKTIVSTLQTCSLAVAISLTTLGTAFAQPVTTTFTRITTGAIATNSGSSETAAWGDYNNDGWEDLFVTSDRGGVDYLYKNNGDGTFTSTLAGELVNDGMDGSAALWGDYDNDGSLDLFITVFDWPTPQRNLLYRNEGNGTFTKVTAGRIVTDTYAGSFSSVWGDYDNDGHIDLFAARVGDALKDALYQNDGAGGFNRILTGPVVNDSAASCGAAWGDYNNDGKLDLFVTGGGTLGSSITGNNLLYRNDGNGTFARITTGAIVNDGGPSEGCAWGDYDNDGFLDLFVANGGESDVPPRKNFLYRNTGTGAFTRVTAGAIATDTGHFVAGSWGDYDNDGFLDVFVSRYRGGNNALYRNNGDGAFEKVTAGSIVNDRGASTACVWGDYDNDGFLDLFVANYGSGQVNFLYHNDGNTNQWLKIKCVGGPSNRAAIGAKVRVQAQNGSGALTWQMREISGGHGIGQNSLITHFGLGNATNAQSVRIEWPSGIVQTLTNVAAKQLLTVTEPPLLQAGLTSGSLQLLLTGGLGMVYEIQASENLTAWTSLGTITNTTRTMQFLDPAAANQPQRFYRAALK